MIVRQMNDEDVKAAANIDAEEFGTDAATSAHKFDHVYRHSVAAIVAEDKGRVIGYAIAVNKEYAWTPNIAYIQLVGVDRRYRSHGVGSAMMERCLETLKQKGYRNAELIVPVEREEAQGLYKKFGFETSAYKMRKKL